MKMVEWEREGRKQRRRDAREKKYDDSSKCVCGDGYVLLVMQSELS